MVFDPVFSNLDLELASSLLTAAQYIWPSDAGCLLLMRIPWAFDGMGFHQLTNRVGGTWHQQPPTQGISTTNQVPPVGMVDAILFGVGCQLTRWAVGPRIRSHKPFKALQKRGFDPEKNEGG